MDYRFRTVYLLIPYLLAGLLPVSCLSSQNPPVSSPPSKPLEVLSDAQYLKREYEGLNGTIRADGVFLRPVEIPVENTFQYISPAEALDFAKRGTGVVFLGAGWCRWCRLIVPEYITIVDEMEAYPPLYYISLRNDGGGRDDKSYQDLAALIGNYLGKAGTSFANITGNPVMIEDYNKRNKESGFDLYPAITLFFNNGVLTGMHVGTVPGHNNSNHPLNDKEKSALRAAFLEHFTVLGTNPCPTKC